MNDDVDVLFPMALPIRLTDKLEVVNMISMGQDKWYGSFALWNNDSNININTKTPVLDLIGQNGIFWEGGEWFLNRLVFENNSCTNKSNSNVYERPCIEGGSPGGGGAGALPQLGTVGGIGGGEIKGAAIVAQ